MIVESHDAVLTPLHKATKIRLFYLLFGTVFGRLMTGLVTNLTISNVVIEGTPYL